MDYDPDMTILEGMGDQDLLASTSEYMQKNPAAGYKRRRPAKGEKVNVMDQTCIDTDDDDFEFEDAQKEERDDNRQHDVSAFMVSNAKASKYKHSMMASEVEGQQKGDVLDYNYIDTDPVSTKAQRVQAKDEGEQVKTRTVTEDK